MNTSSRMVLASSEFQVQLISLSIYVLHKCERVRLVDMMNLLLLVEKAKLVILLLEEGKVQKVTSMSVHSKE